MFLAHDQLPAGTWRSRFWPRSGRRCGGSGNVSRARRGSQAGSATHPHVATAYEAGEREHRPYVVFEYMPNGSLADRLRDNGAPPRPTALRWLEQAAEASTSLTPRRSCIATSNPRTAPRRRENVASPTSVSLDTRANTRSPRRASRGDGGLFRTRAARRPRRDRGERPVRARRGRPPALDGQVARRPDDRGLTLRSERCSTARSPTSRIVDLRPRPRSWTRFETRWQLIHPGHTDAAPVLPARTTPGARPAHRVRPARRRNAAASAGSGLAPGRARRRRPPDGRRIRAWRRLGRT